MKELELKFQIRQLEIQEREKEREWERGEREKEREFQLRMREIEMQERANQPKQKIEYSFDVTKHFKKKKLINTSYTLKKLQKT